MRMRVNYANIETPWTWTIRHARLNRSDSTTRKSEETVLLKMASLGLLFALDHCKSLRVVQEGVQVYLWLITTFK